MSSLATHVTCRLEVDAADWAADACGAPFVARLNSRLPPHVRVFAAPPTPRSFEARHMCTLREYNYLLPVRALTLEAPRAEDGPVGERREPAHGADSPLARERIAALDDALALFEGSHAFHNFTKRKLYAPPPLQQRQRGSSESQADVEGEDACEDEEGDAADEQGAAASSVSSPPAPPGVIGSYGPGGTYWLAAAHETDRVGNSHFRRIARCRVVAPDGRAVQVCDRTGEPYVCIVIAGESFLLHQYVQRSPAMRRQRCR